MPKLRHHILRTPSPSHVANHSLREHFMDRRRTLLEPATNTAEGHEAYPLLVEVL